MTRFKFTPAAHADLREIVDYIAEQSGSDRAESVLRTIRLAIERVAQMPGIGHVREDLTDEDVRFWTVYSYYVVYRPATSPLEIVAIISGWRDVGKELAGRAG